MTQPQINCKIEKVMNPIDIDWNDVIKKEARGINNEDFGEIQDIQGNYVLIEKGISFKS